MAVGAIESATNYATGLYVGRRGSENKSVGSNTTAQDTSVTSSQLSLSISSSTSSGLSDVELTQLAKLQARDLAVRQHELAHLAVSGGLATSAASFTYEKGPDGVNYAVAGEVSIDTSPGQTPAETIQKARQIQAAALAPADPSAQDRAVAASAQQMEIQAMAVLASVPFSSQSSMLGQPDSSRNQQTNAVREAYMPSTITSVGISLYV
ncbi:putative metalloprotease CJM1_0395 family protein [Undibacterium fentianense]|uniref:Catalase n=1 Tax=Undibacterium fentianense TaxID=2828728 RepID=A0A941IDQ5_9BURK|nr:putative metalloprotease CJM1_0395 family protein [Undibacterium fentianense]MBR7801559.1 catalase [Undibacterium fentianense]